MSLAKKLSAAGNNSFPNIDETYEMKVSGTQTIESNDKSYFLVNFKGKRLSDDKDVEHSTILNKEIEISKKEIDEMSKDMASEFGMSFSDFMCSFSCFKGDCEDEILDGYYNPKSDNRTQVYNALAWFALEAVCQGYIDLIED